MSFLMELWQTVDFRQQLTYVIFIAILGSVEVVFNSINFESSYWGSQTGQCDVGTKNDKQVLNGYTRGSKI